MSINNLSKEKRRNGVGEVKKIIGPLRDLNPGPPAPKAGIIPLDQEASLYVFNDIQYNNIYESLSINIFRTISDISYRFNVNFFFLSFFHDF